MSVFSFLLIIFEMDFVFINSKVFLISKNGMMLFVLKVFIIVFVYWYLYFNYF